MQGGLGSDCQPNGSEHEREWQGESLQNRHNGTNGATNGHTRTTSFADGQIDVATAEQEGKWKALLKGEVRPRSWLGFVLVRLPGKKLLVHRFTGLKKGYITSMLIPDDFIR